MMALPRLVPGRGLFAVTGQLGAVLRAELLMQWRRWGFWLAFGGAALLLVLLTLQAALYFTHLPPDSLYAREHYTPADLTNLMIYATTIYGVMFFGLVAALLVVDRLGREQRLGMAEIQQAAPQASACYTLGKFLGNYLAQLIPVLLSYLLCALLGMLLGWSAVLLQKFLLAFVLVYLPSSLAAVGLTLLLSSFLPVRVVQVGFSLLWLFFNIGPGWHKLVYTIFNPSGLYVYPVFFPVPPMLYTEPGFTTSPSLAVLNIVVLCLTGLGALVLTCGSVIIRRRRQERG